MKNLEVNAVSKWRKKDLNPDLHKIGFQLTDVKKKETTIIDRLIDRSIWVSTLMRKSLARASW